MNEQQLIRQLQREGFSHTFAWQDGPNTFYSDHTHDAETAHIIVSGKMTLTMERQTHTYRPGDRCDVPAGVVHSARMGPQGCLTHRRTLGFPDR